MMRLRIQVLLCLLLFGIVQQALTLPDDKNNDNKGDQPNQDQSPQTKPATHPNDPVGSTVDCVPSTIVQTGTELEVFGKKCCRAAAVSTNNTKCSCCYSSEVVQEGRCGPNQDFCDKNAWFISHKGGREVLEKFFKDNKGLCNNDELKEACERAGFSCGVRAKDGEETTEKYADTAGNDKCFLAGTNLLASLSLIILGLGILTLQMKF